MVEPTQEQRAEVISTRSRDRLDTGNTALRDGRRVGTKDQLGSCGRERRKPSDREVFVVQSRIVQQDFGRLQPRPAVNTASLCIFQL